jgi:hypothetical protein
MEACCGAHHLGRLLVEQGHEVRALPGGEYSSLARSNPARQRGAS